ncbi:hypothetical protein evm_012290 [Chilo suppressalis]|nr:hypothetical protein evm_012290 [Chilo suppressalis]
MQSVLCLLFVAVNVQVILGKLLTEEEDAFLPRLYHLDDYERCLASPGEDQLYCMGSFHLTPSKPNHPVYALMEESSRDPMNFNRTLIHRGYCVSTRCPNLFGNGDLNETQRFTECISQWASTLEFHATPISIEYCDNSTQTYKSIELDASKIAFLTVIFCLLFCNIIGTAYDFMSPNEKKRQLLLFWSWRDNWRRLTSNDHSDPERASLMPIHGLRAVLMLLVIWIHCGLIYFRLYSDNPLYLEKMMRDPLFQPVRNGTPVVCVFLMLASFLLARRLLLLPPLKQPSLLLCLLHRLARVYPAYMLVVWWAGSWWRECGAGAAWAGVGRAEAGQCRRGPWGPRALMLHNLLPAGGNGGHCLVQTWFVAVDMQLYIVSCALTLALASGSRRRNLTILSVLFVASCCLNAVLAYVFQWKSMLLVMTPDLLMSPTAGSHAFPIDGIGRLGHDPPRGPNAVLTCLHRLYLPLAAALAWGGALAVGSGPALQRARASPLGALYAALDRPLICALAALALLGYCHHVPSVSRRVLSWRGWVFMSRLSLGALLLHWSVAVSALAASPRPPGRHLAILWDGVATAAFTYALAVPLTLLVEQPLQRTITRLLLRHSTTTNNK